MSTRFLATEPDLQFVAKHEGFVSKAYRCPAGVITIGYGFTWGSKIFRDWWMAKHGRKLRMGDTITRRDADAILRRLMNEEYGAAVNRQVRPVAQHHWGGATSVAFNCGTGSLGWRWATALKSGNVSEAARLLRTTAVTANGRRLPGLVTRRRQEADLIENGNYGAGTRQQQNTDRRARIRHYQQLLKDLGYYKGSVDGVHGKQTDAAVRKFQQDNGLKVDGKVGSATLSTLIRVKDAKVQNKGGQGAGGLGAGGVIVDTLSGDGGVSIPLVITAVVATVAVLGGIWLWRNRGRLTGKRVAVA